MSKDLLDILYDSNWKNQMYSLMSEASIFGLTVFGDGATIKTCPLINILAAGVNNPFALLNVVDCTSHASAGLKKDAKYIARLIHPFIQKMELEVHGLNSLSGAVDLVFFDGATNVQNAGKILAALHPRISVGHGAEHVVSLFFQISSQNVTNLSCFQNFVNRARTFGGKQLTSQVLCLNIIVRSITMELPFDLSNPLNAKWLVSTLPSCGFSN